MRTTIRLRDELLMRAKQKAARDGRSLTSLIEEGLLSVLAKSEGANARRKRLPVSNKRGGVFEGVDINKSAFIEDHLDEAL